MKFELTYSDGTKRTFDVQDQEIRAWLEDRAAGEELRALGGIQAKRGTVAQARAVTE